MYRDGPEILDDKHNETVINDLSKRLPSNRMIAFVGAGLSASPPLNYPIWTALFENLEQFALNSCFCTQHDIDKITTKDKPERAWQLKMLMEKSAKGGYDQFLYDAYKPRSPFFTDTQLALMDLPFQHFLTTNYDVSLENADSSATQTQNNSIIWTETRKVAELLRSLDHTSSDRKVFHIHGRYDVSESIILTSQDYSTCYTSEDGGYMRSAVWGFLSMKSLLFAGFSFDSNDEFTHVARNAKSNFQQFHPNHFAFVGLDESDFQESEKRIEKRKRLRSDYGIAPIFYPVRKQIGEIRDHSALHDLLKEIAQRISESESAKPILQVPPRRPSVVKRGADILKKRMEKEFGKKQEGQLND